MDLSQLPAIPAAKSLLLINNFVANTTRFLNHFAHECEERITRVSDNVTRVEILLAILEAKLNSIPDLSVTDAEVAAAATSDDVRKLNSNQMDLGISDQDLPSVDTAAANEMPLPPPPPPAEHVEVVVDGMPPPPPPSSMDGFEMALTVPRPPSPGALSLTDSMPPPPPPSQGDFHAPPPDEVRVQSDGPSMLKLKDDPVYAKYFTMRRLGIPDSVIEHKLMMDGMSTNILTMDPEGPSPSGGFAPTLNSEPSGPILPIMAPSPPTEVEGASSSDFEDDDDVMDSVRTLPPPPPSLLEPRHTDQLPSGNIGMPFPPPLPLVSPTMSTTEPLSLFGDGLPAALPPPPPEREIEGSSDDDIEEFDVDDRAPVPGDVGVMKVKDDPAFEKYFKMRKLGMPDSVIQHKLMMDGVIADILNSCYSNGDRNRPCSTSASSDIASTSATWRIATASSATRRITTTSCG
uniref:Uncharacterized protein n=1 Tax=Hyaloperonospora arabidopsidis (strain Emoy2) TaxID=559515 RepID=M4C1M4_HYAAE